MFCSMHICTVQHEIMMVRRNIAILDSFQLYSKNLTYQNSFTKEYIVDK